MTRHFTVLGAGVVGTACALSLRRDGHRVTLVDRDEVGAGCSYGNAGMIQTGHCLPMATPGVLRRVPRMLLDPQAPLVVRWRHLPQLAPWLLRFVREAGRRRMEHNAAALSAILSQAKGAHLDLIRAARADTLVRHRGELYVYKSKDAFEAARPEYDFYRAHGVAVDELTGPELRQFEPALDRSADFAYYLPDSIYTVSPLKLTQAYADAFVQAGGEIRRAEVRDIEMDASGPTALVTADGRIEVDALVLATGAFSRRFAKKVGVDVPLESARGYHLVIQAPDVRLNGPVIDGEMHFGIVPMEDGIRLAGTLELASLDAPPNYDRADMLLPMAKALIPDLGAEDGVRWMGHRPGMPDSLPVVGRAPRHRSVYLAFGHGQLGLTLAAITGRMIADLAADRPLPVDPTPYRADRF